jgi:hypothetical protein
MMTTWIRWTTLAALGLMTGAGSMAGDNSVVLTGSFYRGNDTKATHPLKATLTPDGADQWKVVYDFTWGNKPHQYTGTIKGNLKNGAISGSGANEGGKRTWEIQGTAKDGEITFDHWETSGGKRARSGGAMLK